jgi:hypothetical protein
MNAMNPQLANTDVPALRQHSAVTVPARRASVNLFGLAWIRRLHVLY